MKNFTIITTLLLSLALFGCGDSKKDSKENVITKSDKFIEKLDKSKIQPGTDISEVNIYLINSGLSEGLRMKRGDGDTRIGYYTFDDNSSIYVISKPKGQKQGLELVEVKVIK